MFFNVLETPYGKAFSFIHSYTKYWLSTCDIPSTVLGKES